MAYIRGIGDRIRGARERCQLTCPQLAREVGCSEELLASLEAGQFDKSLAIFATLERIASRLGVELDVLMFHDSSLFEVTLNHLRMSAVRIMHDRGLARSLDEVWSVLEIIDFEFDQSMTGHAGAMHYRGREHALHIDEERVRELLRRVRAS